MTDDHCPQIGRNLAAARKYHYPGDTQADFCVRIGVSRRTYAKMEQGDLSVTLGKYLAAARLLGLEQGFTELFAFERSLLDD
jgi:transcriptional regulator with XRE-family HTH domain